MQGCRRQEPKVPLWKRKARKALEKVGQHEKQDTCGLQTGGKDNAKTIEFNFEKLLRKVSRNAVY